MIDFSPAEGLSSGYREASRDRVLTEQELAWHEGGESGYWSGQCALCRRQSLFGRF